jgi:hypothetical protein
MRSDTGRHALFHALDLKLSSIVTAVALMYELCRHDVLLSITLVGLTTLGRTNKNYLPCSVLSSP